MNKENKRKLLENIINTLCKASTIRFNQEETKILSIDSSEYRKYIEENRKTAEQETSIPNEIRIIKDREILRTLGSYIENKTKELIQ